MSPSIGLVSAVAQTLRPTRCLQEGVWGDGPKEANVVIVVQVTTDVARYDIGDGGTIYMTWCGNPAVIEEA